jgi:hypothetical protein
MAAREEGDQHEVDGFLGANDYASDVGADACCHIVDRSRGVRSRSLLQCGLQGW